MTNEFQGLKSIPGVRTTSGRKKGEGQVAVLDRDGKEAVVGVSEGYWPEASDFITTLEKRFGRAGFPRGWPKVYEDSKSLRRLIGKKGVKGIMSKTVDVMAKREARGEVGAEVAGLLRAGSAASYENAEVLEERLGWQVVRGFAVYELYECQPGEAFVAQRHWWNLSPDGTWVDLTPIEEGSQSAALGVRLLVESPELGAKERKLLEFGTHYHSLGLMQEKDKEEKEASRVMAMRSAEESKRAVQGKALENFGIKSTGAASAGAGGPAVSPDAALMNALEAERLIEGLKPYGLEDVGSPAWMSQHETLTRLNLQAHHNVQACMDEFVKEAFISFDKIDTLVHQLLVIEVWKEKVYPHLASAGTVLEGQVGSTNVYLCLYQESLLINLIEIIVFHKDSLEAMTSDSLLELEDYCHRQLVYLNSHAKKDIEIVNRDAKELMNMSKAEEFEDKLKEMRFGSALCALSVLRYLTDYGPDLPLGVMARMLDTHDTIMQLVPVIEERPWVRRRVKGSGKEKVRLMEAFNEGRWQAVPPEDRLKLCKADAQVWIALHNLITDPKCRAKYRYDDFRRETITRLQRFFNEVLFDQIPMLQDLQRVVNEVIFMVTPSSSEVTQGRLILEQVPEVRSALLNRADWRQLARQQASTVFADTEENLERNRAKMNQLLDTFNFMSLLEGGEIDTEDKDVGSQQQEEWNEVLNKMNAMDALSGSKSKGRPLDFDDLNEVE